MFARCLLGGSEPDWHGAECGGTVMVLDADRAVQSDTERTVLIREQPTFNP